MTTQEIIANAQAAARNKSGTSPAADSLARHQHERPSQGVKRKKGGKEAPELLRLLNARAAWNGPPFRQPRFSEQQIAQINSTAAIHSQAFAADPFAAARARMLMLRGIETEQAIREEAARILSARNISWMGEIQ